MKPEISHPPHRPPARPTFAEVYDQGADYVFRTLRRMGVAEADCPDAMQEVFVVVHRRLPAYEPRRKLKGWLAAISANIAARHHEKNRRGAGLGIGVELAADPTEGASASELPPLDLEDAVATRALVLYLLQAIDPERRIVLILHHVDEMTTREIAEALEIPKGTVDTRLRLAQQDFKAAWNRYEARSRRESGRGSIMPIFGPLTLLEAEREVPRIPDELRARIWSRLQHLEHGGGGGGDGGDGGGDDGGKDVAPPAPAAAVAQPALRLSVTGAAVAFGGVFATGFLLGLLWSWVPAKRASTAAPPRPAATAAVAPAASPEETSAAPPPSAALPSGASLPAPAPNTAVPLPDMHTERALIVRAENALHAGNPVDALAVLEEHFRLCRGGGGLAATREDMWVQALLRMGRADEARARIERLARIDPQNPNLDTYRAAAGTPR